MTPELCTYTLKLLGLAAGTYFWMWYLTWELKHYKRKNDDDLKWWEK
jgi:hypothetical protein